LGQRDLSYNEVTSIIGKAIGKPSLNYVQVADDQFRAVLVQTGMSEPAADLLVEMVQALNSGKRAHSNLALSRTPLQPATKLSPPTSSNPLINSKPQPKLRLIPQRGYGITGAPSLSRVFCETEATLSAT